MTAHYLLLLVLLFASGPWANASPSARPALGASPTRTQQQQRTADAAEQPLSAGAIPRAAAHLDEEDAGQHDEQHDGHECGHSLVAHMQEQSVREFQQFARSNTMPPKGSRRMSDYATPGTIRINVQYQISQLSSSQQQAVQRVMDTAVRVVRKFVKIANPLQGALQVRNTAVCAPATIPASLRSGPSKGIASTDFVLFVTSQQSSSCPQASTGTAVTAGALAWAMACDYSLDSASFGRPILGVINLCSGALKAATDAVAVDANAVSGSVVDVFVHELMHALGLSSSMYSTWMGASGGGTSSSDGTNYLNTANARQAAQALLSCSQLPGVPLEDQGTAASAASHWEYRFFNQELMSPYFIRATQRQRLTQLTLGALQDTGWYLPRLAYAQRLDLEQLPAYSLGCSLAMSSCQAFQAQSPGAYYCSNVGADAKNPIKAPGSSSALYKQSPAPGAAAASPTLQCFTPSTPAACDSTPFSNGCGVLRPSPVSCSSTNFALFLPSGTVNQMAGVPGGDSGFYQGLGAYYGSGGACLSWANSSGSTFAGCFDVPRCDASGSPTVLAVVQRALVSIPCAPASSVLLNPYIPVKDTGTSLACPSASQAAAICSSPTPPGYCRNGGACVKGSCSPQGACICDLEYMGSSCSVHVSQVSDFDSPVVNAALNAALSNTLLPKAVVVEPGALLRSSRTSASDWQQVDLSKVPSEPPPISNVEIPLD